MSLTLKVDKASQFEEKACLKKRGIIKRHFRIAAAGIKFEFQ